MALKRVLVDTSVMKRFGNDVVRAKVRAVALDATLMRTTLVDLEVGYSARNEIEWVDLAHELDSFALAPIEDRHLGRALQVQKLLARRSQRGRSIPDLITAAVAEEMGATVLHYDRDFDFIADVTGQTTQWVAPAGELD